MRWIRKGLLFAPPSGFDWAVSHAALPVAEPSGDRVRVYFSGRDEGGRAQIGSFEAELGESPRALAMSPHPVIGLGPLGAFDDHGVTASCVVEHGGRKYHYYSGWSLGVSVPFYFYVGLAVSEDGGLTFRKASAAPVLERNEVDPYLTASPWVLVEGGVFRMWYVSGTGWATEADRPRHFYHIKYAESEDGVRWRREGRVCIDYAAPGEHAFGRPCVVKDADLYRMWYCYRGERYRIGYAESRDGLSWERKDSKVGIDVSPSGWDSEMLAYPDVFDHGGRRWMLYNGNDYGRTGMGLAVLEA